MSNSHLVVLNLPDSPSGEFPDPNSAPIVIDGLPLDYVKSVAVKAGDGERTVVTVAFYAEVVGRIKVGEEYLIKDEHQQ
jgi:hypothetical protein